MKNEENNSQPTIVKYVESNYAGIHLLKLNRCAIGYVTRGTKYIYYGDTTRSVAFWEWYMKELRAYKPDIYTVGECWSGENEILEYYPAMNCFNFAMAQAEKGENASVTIIPNGISVMVKA